MTDTLVDTNIIIDLSGPDPVWGGWSAKALGAAGEYGNLIVNQVIYAELAARYRTREELDDTLYRADFKREDLPWDAAYMAGVAFLRYRRRGGSRPLPLPDFFIGAHAAVRGHRLLTRDRRHYSTYFPTVQLVTPEEP